MNKNRREQRDFPGAKRITDEIAHGPTRVRVALKVLEGAPAREGAKIADTLGDPIGVVTSGGFSPCLKQGVALGFVPPSHAAVGTQLKVIVRDKPQACGRVVTAPFGSRTATCANVDGWPTLLHPHPDLVILRSREDAIRGTHDLRAGKARPRSSVRRRLSLRCSWVPRTKPEP